MKNGKFTREDAGRRVRRSCKQKSNRKRFLISRQVTNCDSLLFLHKNQQVLDRISSACERCLKSNKKLSTCSTDCRYYDDMETVSFNSSNASVHNHSSFAKGFKAFLLCVVMTMSLLGNTMILNAVYRFRRLQTVTNVFILNLSITDLLLSLLAMPFTAISSVTVRWVFGDTMCNIQGVFNSLFCSASIITLTFVSLERFVAILYPFKYKEITTPFVVKIAICYIWFHGAICAASTFLFSRFTYLPFEFICTVDWTYNMPYTICFAVVFLVSPFVIVAYCYCCILKTSLKQRRQIDCIQIGEITTIQNQSLPVMETSSKTRALWRLKHKEHQRIRKTKQEHKATLTIAFIVGAFIVCWFPHAIGVFCLLDPACHWNKNFYVATTWLAMLNSALNSAIYGLMNRGFRRAFKAIICCDRYDWDVKSSVIRLEETASMYQPRACKCRTVSFGPPSLTVNPLPNP